MESGKINLVTFEGIGKFKSIFRAIKRGHVTMGGVVAPKRPFNNRANTSKRKGVHNRVFNQLKRNIYDRFINKSRI